MFENQNDREPECSRIGIEHSTVERASLIKRMLHLLKCALFHRNDVIMFSNLPPSWHEHARACFTLKHRTTQADFTLCTLQCVQTVQQSSSTSTCAFLLFELSFFFLHCLHAQCTLCHVRSCSHDCMAAVSNPEILSCAHLRRLVHTIHHFFDMCAF